MSLYDDYFTNDDKPFAENFNDALLLSNVFDLTVPIELPRMFNNGEWSTGTGQRKAGVSIIQTEGIDNNNITITNNSLIANNDATVLITVYPNFNQYGNLQKVYWEFTEGASENLTVDVLTEQRTVILTNIPNNTVLSSVPYLQQLHKFILRLNFRSGTGIEKLGFIMQNKQQDRYGAEVGISDVNGLEDDLNSLENDLNSLESYATQKISNLNTEVWGSNTQTGDSRIDDLETDVTSLNTSITNKVDTVYVSTVTVNSNLKFTGSPAIRYRRVGKIVTLRLWGSQASPTSTGWINIASIPTGYKPIEDVTIAMQVINNTHIVQARTDNRDTVQCFVSSAGTEYVGLTATWFTNDDYPTE